MAARSPMKPLSMMKLLLVMKPSMMNPYKSTHGRAHTNTSAQRHRHRGTSRHGHGRDHEHEHTNTGTRTHTNEHRHQGGHNGDRPTETRRVTRMREWRGDEREGRR